MIANYGVSVGNNQTIVLRNFRASGLGKEAILKYYLWLEANNQICFNSCLICASICFFNTLSLTVCTLLTTMRFLDLPELSADPRSITNLPERLSWGDFLTHFAEECFDVGIVLN